MKKSLFIIAMAVAAACNNTGTKNNAEKPADEQPAEAATKPGDLLGREWKLKELNGAAIVLDTLFPNQPHFKFTDLNSINGNLGCNGFGAKVAFTSTDSIHVADIVATQMACPNLKVEQQFMEALGNTKTYKLEGATLLLNNEKQEVVAKLENNPAGN